MQNIDAFNRVVVAIFAQLYGNFPRPVTIEAAGIRSSSNVSADQWFENKSGENTVSVAIDWLSEEGFIRMTANVGGKSFMGVVLTSKGLAALNRTPASLEAGPTLGERMLGLGEVATKEVLAAIMRTALGG